MRPVSALWRTRRALARTAAGLGMRLRSRDAAAMAAAVVEELGQGLVDEDRVSPPESPPLITGRPMYGPCPGCGRDGALVRWSLYVAALPDPVRAGSVAVCQVCGYSPFAR
ncbi:hypothetical protein [Nocardiopsis sp. CNR-923]|uniref:hypothetical protein n=1 Tax=Nocardiopsis sp. CNR-923 TaxID=1904965 RepID=UPI00096A9368|nr:hypothetical protein [Nocardiopsis sp. CNR-923]